MEATPDAAVSLHSSRHIPALDGLRGLAIILVFVFHFGEHKGHDGLAQKFLFKMTDAGWTGVDIFFVLSGFLITGILLDTKGQYRAYQRFFVRRALRIFPLYYLYLFFVFVALGPLIRNSTAYLEILRDQPWYWFYLQNWKIAFAGWPHFAFVDHLWSLAVEEQFYVLWPLAVFTLSRRRLVVVAVALIVVAPFLRAAIWLLWGSHPVTVGVSTFTRMDSLGMGALTAILARSKDGTKLLMRWASPLGTLAVAALLGIFVLRRQLLAFDRTVQVAGVSAVCLMAATAIAIAITRTDSALPSMLAFRPLRAVGKVSYAAYIIHVPILLLVDPWVEARTGFVGAGNLALGFAVCALLTWMCARFSWVAFEKPILGLRAALEDKIGNAVQTQPES